MENLLKVSNLSVVLDNQIIIEDVSFEIGPKETISIIGPNGAGKTVLLKTLIGAFKPTMGKIEFSEKAKVGYLPQRFSVDRYLAITVQEFLGLKPNINEEKMLEALSEVSLGKEFFKKPLASLSAGQMQRVLIAWIISDKPNLILFDEPTENVDVVGQESIYQLLRKLQNDLNLSIILVSHDLNIVYKYSDKVICLNKKMLCLGTPLETLDQKMLELIYGEHAYYAHDHHLVGNNHHNHHHDN
jgi:zinc transport system ATP-binding protein